MGEQRVYIEPKDDQFHATCLVCDHSLTFPTYNGAFARIDEHFHTEHDPMPESIRDEVIV